MITSKQNATIKLVRALQDKKNRDKENLFVVESVKLVLDALCLSLPIIKILGTEKGLNALGKDLPCIEEVSEEVFRSISSHVSPQGVLAIIKKPTSVVQKVKGNCLLLDGVSDPANVGAIIRTAAASGYDTVCMTDECADPFSPKSVQSAMGGIFRVKTVRASAEQLLNIIDAPIVVADMAGESVFKKKIKGDVCLVIGNEGKGVSDLIRGRAQYLVSIPMLNQVESLNAGVSAGILMYNLKNIEE